MIRLINTSTLAFEELENPVVPRYAIVSHCWGRDEVTYQDFLDGRRRDSHGWTKISKACEIARSYEMSYLWIDTCCIDKKSSAELSEAINSMYRWYYHSHDCYVLLPDVRAQSSSEALSDQFRESIWFRRGWTLQELLAPRRLLFFNTTFEPVGDKFQRCNDIAAASGIDTDYLLGLAKVQEASVAERMQWASLRQTSRSEDIAYCLLGLFDVNMPLLYGEGPKAFVRLQLEIIRKSDDESIFAWWQEPAELGSWRGLLAPLPKAFACPRGETTKILKGQWRHPYSMTNKGLELNLSLPKTLRPSHRSGITILMPLNCERVSVTEDNKVKRQHIALRINVNGVGQSDVPIFEGSQFRDKRREDKLVLAEALIFEKPSTYGCFYTVGMHSESTSLDSCSIYFKQDGV